MILQFGNIIIDADIDKTRSFYESSRILTDDCMCENCQNFVSGAEKLSPDILKFFQHLGIDILKPAEMVAWSPEDNGKSRFYGGWYHLCGRLMSDSECWKSETDNNGKIRESLIENRFFSITDNFSIGFTNKIMLRKADFPDPVVQMEILVHHFPWVLNSTS